MVRHTDSRKSQYQASELAELSEIPNIFMESLKFPIFHGKSEIPNIDGKSEIPNIDGKSEIPKIFMESLKFPKFSWKVYGKSQSN